MRKTFHEPPRELPVIAETEVLVCGAGPAGIGAALQAARNGAKTMLIEYQDCLGGVATAGMMSHWTGCYCRDALFREAIWHIPISA